MDYANTSKELKSSDILLSKRYLEQISYHKEQMFCSVRYRTEQKVNIT